MIETIWTVGLVVSLAVTVINADRRRRRLADLVDKLVAAHREQTAAHRNLGAALLRLDAARAAQVAELRAQIAELSAAEDALRSAATKEDDRAE